jgi:hypothetical protein
MTLIEIAVYAALLSGGQPMACHVDEDEITLCSNGIAASSIGPNAAHYSTGVTVRHEGTNFPVFSNGMTSWFSSAHWLQFSNGLGIRRLPAATSGSKAANGSKAPGGATAAGSIGAYEFSNGLICRAELPSLVICATPHRAP